MLTLSRAHIIPNAGVRVFGFDAVEVAVVAVVVIIVAVIRVGYSALYPCNLLRNASLLCLLAVVQIQSILG